MIHASLFVILAFVKAPPKTQELAPQFIEVASLDLKPEPKPEAKTEPAAPPIITPAGLPKQAVSDSKPAIKPAPKKIEKRKPNPKPTPSKPQPERELPPAVRNLSSESTEPVIPPSTQASQDAADGGETSGSPAKKAGSKTSSEAEEAYEVASYSSPSLHNPPTSYPSLAKDRGLEGRVKLRVQVLADGSAGSIQIQQSSGYDLLDESAVEQLRKWHFIPAHRGDKPVESWVIVPISFMLRH